jgi:hypothetical protein
MIENNDQKKLIKQVLNACNTGDLAKIKSLMAKINIDFSLPQHRETAKNIYKQACFSGHLNIVDELIYLTDGDAKNSFIKSIFEDLVDIKKSQYYPVISYLVNEPKLEVKRSPPGVVSEFYGNLNLQIHYAAINDNLPLVKALLNTHEPEKRNKWVFTTSKLFKEACKTGNSEVMKYLYSEPNFKNILNPLLGLIEACRAENKDVIQFIIFDYRIKLTEEVSSYLKKSGNKHLISMIEKRELSEQLNTELNHNSEISKKLKI